ncbi:hypothetical protein THF1C08_30066 [Vibrio jasicida]|uniref:Uncharacterized protein n=1 Tax=Vibrio jasicida TaxID=766224 RepID=A0AAU9QRS6_9VIBR|nr:hypothetical protein THF1C08_30066 [Vibrio jasicida]CAH1599979.1 hypothetical protein THF1A12_40370 [Vibrio jasicida]
MYEVIVFNTEFKQMIKLHFLKITDADHEDTFESNRSAQRQFE